ncbi:MAG: hypothetical protein Q8M94_10180, partial [Ignavibacteria bacterium]|nr:hypothetical protein [Ignavibacteria bacterium]
MYLLKPFILFISLSFLWSCSSDISKPKLDEIIIFPAPPEPTKIQYLTHFSSSKDVTGEQSGVMDYVAGESDELTIIKPYGISIYKGRIYICDT